MIMDQRKKNFPTVLIVCVSLVIEFLARYAV